MLHLNEDGTITNTMTAEEDDEMVTELRRRYAYEEGVKDTALSMIKERIPLKTISRVTKISLEDLKQLKTSI